MTGKIRSTRGIEEKLRSARELLELYREGGDDEELISVAEAMLVNLLVWEKDPTVKQEVQSILQGYRWLVGLITERAARNDVTVAHYFEENFGEAVASLAVSWFQ